MVTGSNNIDLADVPFDQYSRQLIVKNIIEHVFRQNSNKKFTVLDVGGYMGRTVEFLPNDKVDVLDVFDVDAPNYIKGDATKMLMGDKSYDFVCSFDVLEHIPKAKRESFIKESARVANKGFFIAAPTDDADGLVSLVEHEVNDVFKIVNGQNHRWLKEHIENGIPNNQFIENIITKQGLFYTVIKSNDLINWLSIQSTFFIKSVLDKPDNFLKDKYLPTFYRLHQNINESYNKNYSFLENQNGSLSYRTVYFVSSDQKSTKLVEKYLIKHMVSSSSGGTTNKALIEVYSELFKAIAETVSILQKEGNSLKDKEQQLTALQLEVKGKDKYINDLQHSFSWRITKPFRELMSLFMKRSK